MLTLRPISRFFHAAVVLASTDIRASAVVASNETPGTLSNQIHYLKSLDRPALEKLKAERDPEKLFHLFNANAHNKLVIESRFAFEDTISRLAGAQRFDYIELLLEHQKTLPQGRREGFSVRIIMLYGRAGMTENAIQTFYDMHFYGCRRTVKSFNAALTVLTQTSNLVAIEAFLDEVPEKFGIEVDIFSVNIVVNALCNMGILDKAFLFMVVMEKAGIRPDVFTYTTLISAFYKINRGEIGNGIWNLMVLKRCFPNLATFNVRIQYLVNGRRAWQANSVLALMQNIGINSDEVTYNLVIKGFCQAGYLEMAKRVYSSLHGNGYKTNVKIYQTMIHYLVKGGEFDLAYTMCKDCMNRNWFPNVETIYTLLDGLKKSKKVDKAIFIMRLAQKRVPPFSPNQLARLQLILSNS